MNDRIYYSREAELRANRERTAAVLVFLGVGVAIGTALALLFAPQSGKETRRELESELEDRFEEGRETTSSTVRRLEKEFGELRKRLEDRISDMR